ncbi:MAG: hypothetical protein ACLR8L_06770 [Oscillospiraceae bacterium]
MRGKAGGAQSAARRHSVRTWLRAGDALCRLAGLLVRNALQARYVRTSTQSGYEDRIRAASSRSWARFTLVRADAERDLQQFYARLKKSGRRTRTEYYGEGLS